LQKNAKYRYYDKKGHYKKKSHTTEKDLKSKKPNIAFKNNQANIIKAKEDIMAFVVALSTSLSRNI